MPVKKKKGKASKFARMNDDERARYLQHRAELELEAKRRKQQLIAVYSKLKFQREENFSRLNNAKINEQWRCILRKIKCKELHECAEYLWQNFDRTLNAKDAIIHKLYEQLHMADLNHRRLQEAHVEAIDRFIDKKKQRLEFLKDIYSIDLHNIEFNDITEFAKEKIKLNEAEECLKVINFAQDKDTEEKLMKTRTRNAVNTLIFEYSNEEEILYMKHNISYKMQDLWLQLNRVILQYETSTEDKRKQYEYMKELDDACRTEAAYFPKLQSQLQTTVEHLKSELQNLTDEKKENIIELKKCVERLNNRVWKLRQEVKLFQTTDALQLKRLSVISNGVIKNLKEITEKSLTLRSLMKICSELELTTSVNTTFSEKDIKVSEEICAIDADELFDVMHKFLKKFNYVKAENFMMKKERNNLISENNRMRHTLRSYLISVSNVPSIRSCV